MKLVLPFETLPKGLPFGGKITYCIVDISGIQRYIFHAMDCHTTPEEIRNRSAFVEHLTHFLGQQLSQIAGYLFGSDSSGKLLCCLHPSIKESTIRSLLDRLQRSVFASTRGQLTFYYALCSAKCIPETRFRETGMEHAGAYLGRQLENEKLHCLNLLDVDMVREENKALIPPVTPTAPAYATEDQAVVKLDLDNLGDFFHRIPTYDKHHRVSKALEAIIKTCQNDDPRIVSIFAGGDDIFFLCPLSAYLSVIAGFYRNLRQKLANDPVLSLYEREHFGISAGISVLRNKLDTIPLASYWESTEDALHAAKTKGNKNCLYFQLPNKEQQYIGWEDLCFLADIYQRLREQVLAQHRFTGTDLVNLNLLTDQLIICGKNNNQVTKKELSRLYDIKNRTV